MVAALGKACLRWALELVGNRTFSSEFRSMSRLAGSETGSLAAIV